MKAIFITGASGGIGRALAVQYAAPEVTLVLLGRNKAELDKTATRCIAKGATVQSHLIDITTPEYEHLLATLAQQYAFNLVFANAGASLLETFATPQPQEVTKLTALMEINFTSQVKTAFGLFESLKKARGQIVFTASLAGLRGLPQDPAYSASKGALSLFFEGLRPSWKKQGIGVTLIHAGFIKTAMSDKLTTPKPFCISAEQAAGIIQTGVARQHYKIILPWQQKWLFWLGQCVPAKVMDYFLMRYM